MTSLTPKQTTLFAVARNGKPINDDATADVRTAQQLLSNAADGMIGAGLEPDLELVTIEQTISFGEPQRYVEPSPVEETEAQPYAGVKVPELKAEIASRNEGRGEADQLATEGKRADLVAALVADDEAQARARRLTVPNVAGGKRKSTRAGKASRAAFREQCQAEGAPCWMCGMPIDYTAAPDDWTNDDRFEVDHFFPVSTHPELQDDPDNYRASNAGCNRERSNNAAAAPLGELSQAWT